MTTSGSIPTRRRDSSRRVRTARPRSSTPSVFGGPTRIGPARSSGSGHLRDARRHVHARGHVGCRCTRLPELAKAWHHLHRADAGGRVPGRFGWGYDGVDLFAPDAALRRPDDFRRFVDAPTRSASASSSTSSTTTSGRRQLPAASSRRRTSPTATPTTGARRSTSTAPTAAPVREFFVENAALLDRRVPPRRPAARRHAADLRRLGRAHPGGDRAARARRGRRARRSCSSPRTSRRTRAWCGPTHDGGYGLDALWNDDFHHSAIVAAHRRAARPTTRDYRARRRNSSRRAKWRLPVPGPALRLAAGAARDPGARTCRRARSSPSRRTTIRSATPPAAAARATCLGRTACRSSRPLLLRGPRRPCCFRARSSPRRRPFLYFADHEGRARRGGRRAPPPSSRRSAGRPEDVPDPQAPATFPRPPSSTGRSSDREPHARCARLVSVPRPPLRRERADLRHGCPRRTHARYDEGRRLARRRAARDHAPPPVNLGSAAALPACRSCAASRRVLLASRDAGVELVDARPVGLPRPHTAVFLAT